MRRASYGTSDRHPEYLPMEIARMAEYGNLAIAKRGHKSLYLDIRSDVYFELAQGCRHDEQKPE